MHYKEYNSLTLTYVVYIIILNNYQKANFSSLFIKKLLTKYNKLKFDNCNIFLVNITIKA